MDNQFLTVQEVSEYLHIKPATLYSKVGGGEIPHYKVGRLVRFKREDVDDWMEKHRQDPSDADRKAKAILRATNKSSLAVDEVVKKAIAEGKEMMYPSHNGRPDRIRGLGKEVKDEFV